MEERTAEATTLPSLEVYWRPGCPYCYRLLDTLEAAGVQMVLHNIWEDETARAIVAGINRGNETVPTIVLGDRAETNPSPRELLDTLHEARPDLFQPPAQASAD